MSFSERVYLLAKRIPEGKVSTYKLIASKLKVKAYRAVGNALNKNPYSPIIPCHRIVNHDGSIGGFASGTQNKIRILKEEGIIVENGKIKDFKEKLFRF